MVAAPQAAGDPAGAIAAATEALAIAEATGFDGYRARLAGPLTTSGV